MSVGLYCRHKRVVLFVLLDDHRTIVLKRIPMTSFRLINVLSPETFADCYITGSINVPFEKLAEYTKDLPKDTEMIVYCASYVCPMSRRAWQLLKDLGFTQIRAYEGGAAEWHALGYPTEGPAQMSYLKEEYDQPAHTGEKIATISAQELKKKLGL